jgi:dCMP deaminase
MSRPNQGVYFLSMAKLVSVRATCCRRSVGCVLVNERGHVLSTGYNGVAAGQPHCNEVTRIYFQACLGADEERREYANACSGSSSPSGTNLDACKAVHAEQNALIQCRNVWEIDTAYVTVSPCVTCTKMLLNTSCKRIVFSELYPQPAAEELWTSSGREWVDASNEELI